LLPEDKKFERGWFPQIAQIFACSTIAMILAGGKYFIWFRR
jgi:hypothetical protein